jgi:hypothetical protein
VVTEWLGISRKYVVVVVVGKIACSKNPRSLLQFRYHQR